MGAFVGVCVSGGGGHIYSSMLVMVVRATGEKKTLLKVRCYGP
jgi:hypothetical protein